MNALAQRPVPDEAVAVSQSGPPARAPRSRKVALRAGAAAVVVLAGVVVGHWWLTESRWIESTDNAYVQGDIAVLGARIEGDVAAIHVVDNQVVRRGESLISLDPTLWQAKFDQARGQAAEAAAAIETARRQVEQSRAAITQAEAMIAQAQAEMTRASADAARSGALVGSGWTSRQSNDLAVAGRDKASAQLAAARSQRDSAAHALDVAQAQVAQAMAHKTTLDAAVRLAQHDLDDTEIRAPFDGTVGNRAAQLGQHVIPQLQLISVTPARSQLYVVANFKETQLRRMQPGQKVTITPDIDSDAAVEGHVDSLAPATGALYSLLPPENATGNFTKVVQRVPTKIIIDMAQAARAGWLRAGLSVTAEVDTRGANAVRRGLFGGIPAMLGLD